LPNDKEAGIETVKYFRFLTPVAVEPIAVLGAAPSEELKPFIGTISKKREQLTRGGPTSK
jgi:hypothetical protein